MSDNIVASTIVDEDDVSETVVARLIEQLGEMPKSYYIELTLQIVVTPLPDPKELFVYKLWSCFG
jgi:hypothetical protein